MREPDLENAMGKDREEVGVSAKRVRTETVGKKGTERSSCIMQLNFPAECCQVRLE